jgi:pimeloyl-ACP methyl ester carboxylesterase
VRYCCRVTAHVRPEFAPIVFLSGAFQTMDSWARFAKAFTPLTTVVLVDLPGTGRSDVLQALAPGCSPIARTGYRETSSQVFVSG